jgi:hypothetical protein
MTVQVCSSSLTRLSGPQFQCSFERSLLGLSLLVKNINCGVQILDCKTYFRGPIAGFDQDFRQ